MLVNANIGKSHALGQVQYQGTLFQQKKIVQYQGTITPSESKYTSFNIVPRLLFKMISILRLYNISGIRHFCTYEGVEYQVTWASENKHTNINKHIYIVLNRLFN